MRKSSTVSGKGEGGGVGVVAEEHRGGGFGVAVLGEKRDKAKLGYWGRPGTVFKTPQKINGLLLVE